MTFNLHSLLTPKDSFLTSAKLLSLLTLATIALPHFSEMAIATPVNSLPQTQVQLRYPSTTQLLPQVLVNRVLSNASQRLGVPRSQLQIERYSRETWSDSCLGLGTLTESCAQVTVPGWQIEVAHEQRSLFYHTDGTGQVIRLAEQAQLPFSVGDRLLQQASAESGIPVTELKIVSAEPQFWDGCLGIYAPNQACTEIGISGWRAIVSNDSQSWIYHTDNNGSDIRLNRVAGTIGIIPQFLSDQTDSPLAPEVVFHMTRSGGFAGQTIQIMLLTDGEVIQVPPHTDGSSVPYLLNQLSPQEVQAFTEFLEQHRFQNFNGLSYPPTEGAADYFTVTLAGQSGTTQYADIGQEQLPSELQQIIQQWEQLQQ